MPQENRRRFEPTGFPSFETRMVPAQTDASGRATNSEPARETRFPAGSKTQGETTQPWGLYQPLLQSPRFAENSAAAGEAGGAAARRRPWPRYPRTEIP